MRQNKEGLERKSKAIDGDRKERDDDEERQMWKQDGKTRDKEEESSKIWEIGGKEGKKGRKKERMKEKGSVEDAERSMDERGE